jgi:hypothetical protein
MRAIWLIALNFVRQNRWLIALLVAWPSLFALILYFPDRRFDAEDVTSIIRQESFYALAISIFTSCAAIYNERRSRRILFVLSKGVTRLQYLAGLVFGTLIVAGLYSLCIAATGFWMTRGIPSSGLSLVRQSILLLVLVLFTSSIGIFFSTFMHPMLATAVTGMALALPIWAAFAAGPVLDWFPIGKVVLLLSRYSPDPTWQPNGASLLVLVAEAAGFWILAGMVFAYRDITLPVE